MNQTGKRVNSIEMMCIIFSQEFTARRWVEVWEKRQEMESLTSGGGGRRSKVW
jgi:hypothetical protein